ncbi:MAG: arylsulfatase [Planctomycetes bacterium]|nr:arylsulfatase [Planctomycetota bacterium]
MPFLRTASALLLAAAAVAPAPAAESRPNIVFIFADNLGYGELGCYGGGVMRGAPTPRIDALAAQGTRLTNMNMEPQCTPSRASMLTGRWAIRSGCHSVPFGGGADGLTRWEVTIGEVLSEAGYATGYFGKWHLGSDQGRHPTDQGFDQWFGIPRTSDESLWPVTPGYSPDILPVEHVLEGERDQPSRDLGIYDLERRRQIDGEITRRSADFIARQAKAGRPFLACISLTQPHLPTEPGPAWKGRTGHGNWADMLAEMDHHVGELLDAIDQAGAGDNTVVVFTSDNGAEFTRPWDGCSGPWRGQYFTALEGGLRVPFLVRWPGKVPAGRVSNEVMHGVDLFATFAGLGAGRIPADRPIDSRDQRDFLLGRSQKSARDSFLVFVGDRLQAAKWRNYKLHFYRQDTMVDPPVRYPVPMVCNLFTDPREEKPGLTAWVVAPVMKMVEEYEASVRRFPNIPMGTPDPYIPPR